MSISNETTLVLGQAGFENFLARELTSGGATVIEQGPGWVRTNRASANPDLVFAHLSLLAPVEISGESVNALAQRVAESFFNSVRGERIDAPWPSVWRAPQEIVGLGRRLSSVDQAFGELLRKKLSRVAKLAMDDVARGVGAQRGLFVFFTDFGRAWVAREAFVHGQHRMADDDLAPSRSYLKVEEAYGILGREPQPGETVVDLGAAPGGWSYSAAKRGARVIAIDNGPLKGGALDHPLIEHRREDAFKFAPAVEGKPPIPDGTAYDWLFCDMVEEPHNVLRNIIEPWLAGRGCGRFVINLKFGRVDPLLLLAELRAPESPVVKYAPGTRIRHLYHDREELTLVGELK